MPVRRPVQHKIVRRPHAYANPNSPAARIRDLRKEQGVTQEKLAQLVGVTPATISNWENAGMRPRREHFSKLAQVFGQNETYLRTGAFKNYQDLTKVSTDFLGILAEMQKKIALSTGWSGNRVKVTVEFCLAESETGFLPARPRVS